MDTEEKAKDRKSFITRTIAGFVMTLILGIAFIIRNIYVVDVVIALLALISLNEYYNATSKISNPIKWVGYLGCLLIALCHVIPEEYRLTALLLMIPTSMLLMFLQVIITNMKTTFKDAAYTFFGIIYVVFFLYFLTLLYGKDYGYINIWLILIASWGTDVGAYLIGKPFGKHKFSKISPKKSIEGCIAGIIFAVLVNVAFISIINQVLGLNYNVLIIAAITAVLSILSQVGDFIASSIKRFVDIKDYSNLIPGHGGMLDRVDSLLFIAPFAFFLIEFLVKL